MKASRYFMQLNASHTRPLPCPERDIEAYFLTLFELSGVARSQAEHEMQAGIVLHSKDGRCRFWSEGPRPRNRDEIAIEWNELLTAQNLEYLLDNTHLLEILDPTERGGIRRAAELLRQHAPVASERVH